MSKYCSVEEAAVILGVSADDVRDAVKEGKISAIRRAGELALRVQDVQKMAGGAKAEEPAPVVEPARPVAAQPKPSAPPVASAVRLSIPGRGLPELTLERRSQVKVPAASSVKAPGVAHHSDLSIKRKVSSEPLVFDADGYLPWEGCERAALRANGKSLSGKNVADSEGELPSGPLLPGRLSCVANRGKARFNGKESAGSLALSEGLVQGDDLDLLGVSALIEKALEPITKVQTKLIKSVNDMGQGAGGRAVASSTGSNVEQRLKRLEALLQNTANELHNYPSLSDFKQFRRNCELMLNNIGEEVAAFKKYAGPQGAKKGAEAAGTEEAQALAEQVSRLKAKLHSSETRLAEVQDALSEAVKDKISLSSGLQEQVGDLAGNYEKLLAEHNRLQSENSTCQTQLEETRLQLEDMRSDNLQLQEQLTREHASAVNAEEWQELKSKSAALEADCLELRKQNETLKDKVDSLTVEHMNDEDSLVMLRAQLAEASNAGSVLQSARTELAAECEKLTDKLAASQEDLQRVKDSCKEVQKKYQQSLAQCETLSEQLRKSEKDRLNLRDQCESLVQDTDDLKEEIIQLKTFSSSSNVQMAELESVAGEAESERIRLMDALEALQADHDALQLDYKDLQEECDGLKERCQEAKEALAVEQAAKEQMQLSRDAVMREAQESLSSVEAERNRLSKRQNALQAKIDSLTAELEAAQLACAELEAATAKVEAPLTESEAISALNREVSQLRRDLQISAQEKDLVLHERDVAAKKALEFQDQLKALQSQKAPSVSSAVSANLQSQIASLEEELGAREDELQELRGERKELRRKLEESQRSYVELQGTFDKEKREWSEILARSIQQREGASHGESGPDDERRSGWRLFKNRGN